MNLLKYTHSLDADPANLPVFHLCRRLQGWHSIGIVTRGVRQTLENLLYGFDAFVEVRGRRVPAGTLFDETLYDICHKRNQGLTLEHPHHMIKVELFLNPKSNQKAFRVVAFELPGTETLGEVFEEMQDYCLQPDNHISKFYYPMRPEAWFDNIQLYPPNGFSPIMISVFRELGLSARAISGILSDEWREDRELMDNIYSHLKERRAPLKDCYLGRYGTAWYDDRVATDEQFLRLKVYEAEALF